MFMVQDTFDINVYNTCITLRSSAKLERKILIRSNNKHPKIAAIQIYVFEKLGTFLILDHKPLRYGNICLPE